MDYEFGIPEIIRYIQLAWDETGRQVALLLLPSLFLVVVLHFLSRQLLRKLAAVIGWERYLSFFGWLGIRVHELGHLIFSLLSLQLVSDVKLFMRRPPPGVPYGWVAHAHVNSAYDRLRIGSLFIGIGPILFGSILIFLMARLLVDADIVASWRLPTFGLAAFGSIDGLSAWIADFTDAFWVLLSTLLARQDFGDWRLYAFLYVGFAIASAMTLSWSDIITAFMGFVALVFALFLANLLTLWSGPWVQEIMSDIAPGATAMYGILMFVLVFSSVIGLGTLLILSVLQQVVRAMKTALKKK